MKVAYPVIITKDKDFFVVDIPDFGIATQGIDLANAIEMARDAIGLMGIDMEDCKKPLPSPGNPLDIQTKNNNIVTLVDIDFVEYRHKSASFEHQNTITANPFDGLISLKEAAERWHKDEGNLRHAIARGKLKEGEDAQKFGKQWVVTVQAMEREWGKQESK